MMTNINDRVFAIDRQKQRNTVFPSFSSFINTADVLYCESFCTRLRGFLLHIISDHTLAARKKRFFIQQGNTNYFATAIFDYEGSSNMKRI